MNENPPNDRDFPKTPKLLHVVYLLKPFCDTLYNTDCADCVYWRTDLWMARHDDGTYRPFVYMPVSQICGNPNFYNLPQMKEADAHPKQDHGKQQR